MLRTIAILTTFLVASLCYGQDKEQKIKLSFKHFPKESVYLGEQGFVMRFGRRSKKNSESQLQYYNATTNLVWEKTIIDHYGGFEGAHLVASPSGNTMYFVEFKKKNMSGGYVRDADVFITQVTRNGDIQESVIPKGSEVGKSLQAIFCDDKNLYIITTKEGNERHKKKKAEE